MTLLMMPQIVLNQGKVGGGGMLCREFDITIKKSYLVYAGKMVNRLPYRSTFNF